MSEKSSTETNSATTAAVSTAATAPVATSTAAVPNPQGSTGVTAASGASPLYPDLPPPTAEQVERARMEAGWKSDLARLEYEIETLRTVLNAKNNQAAELKRKLGITSITEMKQDLQQGLQAIKESDAFLKTENAFKTFGDYATRKLSDLRNSNAFKSVEGKVGSAYQSVKTSQSVGNLRNRMSRSSTTTDEGFTDMAGNPSGGITSSTSVSSGLTSSAVSSNPDDSTSIGNSIVNEKEKPAPEKSEGSQAEKSGAPL